MQSNDEIVQKQISYRYDLIQHKCIELTAKWQDINNTIKIKILLYYINYN
jgi:hypothetical protein